MDAELAAWLHAEGSGVLALAGIKLIFFPVAAVFPT